MLLWWLGIEEGKKHADTLKNSFFLMILFDIKWTLNVPALTKVLWKAEQQHRATDPLILHSELESHFTFDISLVNQDWLPLSTHSLTRQLPKRQPATRHYGATAILAVLVQIHQVTVRISPEVSAQLHWLSSVNKRFTQFWVTSEWHPNWADFVFHLHLWGSRLDDQRSVLLCFSNNCAWSTWWPLKAQTDGTSSSRPQ